MAAGIGSDALSAPAGDYKPVTPSNSVNLPAGECRGLWIGGAGDITVVSQYGSVATFKAVPAGTVVPIFAVRVNATGTTATDIVALY